MLPGMDLGVSGGRDGDERSVCLSEEIEQIKTHFASSTSLSIPYQQWLLMTFGYF